MFLNKESGGNQRLRDKYTTNPTSTYLFLPETFRGLDRDHMTRWVRSVKS